MSHHRHNFGHSKIGSMETLRAVLALLLLLLGVMQPAWAQTTQKLFQTCCLRGGGAQLVAGDPAKIANFDLAILLRFHYDSLGGNVWAQIKAYNPNILIYLYEMGSQMASGHDSYGIEYLNDLGRYDNSRGHPMGSLDGDHLQLFLLDASNARLYDPDYSRPPTNHWYLMDFGSPTYQAYWVEGARNDIASQQWVADGIFADRCEAIRDFASAKYSTTAQWNAAMTSFCTGIANDMQGLYGQKIYCNVGNTRFADGQTAWEALDASAVPPDAILEEGAFAVKWGAPQGGGVWFFSRTEWLGQINLMSQIHHSKVVYESHCSLAEGASGTDQYGNQVGFWDVFWFAMTSYLIGKNTTDNNSYFAFAEDGNTVYFQGELAPGAINLGNAVGNYVEVIIGDTHLYRRDFDNGYVYVNPSMYDAPSVTLPSDLQAAHPRQFHAPSVRHPRRDQYQPACSQGDDSDDRPRRIIDGFDSHDTTHNAGHSHQSVGNGTL